MMKFVVDRVCGTAAADGGAALKRNAETLTNGDSVSTWGGESMDNDVPEPEPEPSVTQYTDTTVNWHSTVDNESWNEILDRCKVPSNQIRNYLYWCKSRFKIGNDKQFRRDPEALFFPSPMKHNMIFPSKPFVLKMGANLWRSTEAQRVSVVRPGVTLGVECGNEHSPRTRGICTVSYCMIMIMD